MLKTFFVIVHFNNGHTPLWYLFTGFNQTDIEKQILDDMKWQNVEDVHSEPLMDAGRV